MSLEIAFKNVEHLSKNIPTRFDDIRNDITKENMKKYYKSVESKEPVKYIKLGDILGSKLDKII